MYPDEPHYIDAGVLMCQSGDWLTPAVPNGGDPDDIKPILTYWIVALSYKMFGTSLAAAQLPYLLAGAVVIWLTYRLAMLLTSGSRSAAALAAILLVYNVLFWMSAIRALPDIWLCLFLVTSAYGFIGIAVCETPIWHHPWLAYVGAGLAVLAKGIPAVVFLSFAMVFVGTVLACQQDGRRRLVHWPSMAVGTGVALSWFVIVYCTRGPDILGLLWSDQVSTRVRLHPWKIAIRLTVTFAAMAVCLSPLCWPLAKMSWRRVLPSSRRECIGCGFLVGWTALNVLAMSATPNWSVRYLLPTFPMLAVLFALMLNKVDPAILQRCFRCILAVLLAGMSVVACAVCFVGTS